MKPLIKHMTLSLALITLIAFSFISEARADYYMVYVKYKCPIGWVTATYKERSLKRARQVQDTFRRIPKYRNTWIRFVRE